MNAVLAPDILKLFQENGTQVILETGEVLCRQGDPSNAVYLVINGGLTVYVKDTETSEPMLLNCVEAGEFLGELGAITGHPRSATLIANQRSVLQCIPTPEFKTLLVEKPELAQVMVATTRDHLVSADVARIHMGHTYQKMRKRVMTLGEEKEQLQELLRLREEMESMLVHDLKNPLNIITAGLSLLTPEIKATEEIKEKETVSLVLTLMDSAAKRMQQLIVMLLDIAKMEAGKMVLNIQTFNFAEVVQMLIETQKTANTRTDITLLSKLPSGFTVRGDRDLLLRVLTNLLDNAIKFTPTGGAVEVRAQTDKQTQLISITDSGPGIPPEERERIFDKFTQIDDEQHKAQRGTGLGLTFCRMAIEAHGGRIWVESGPNGIGSSFHFSLPQ
ncbi:MAG: cyclic nucleotide-binding domain-containing protein [Anaerolineae bacterium]|nr:cyclic nucleotide-binding domain-containing protein [Anaerolineae bacterium]